MTKQELRALAEAACAASNITVYSARTPRQSRPLATIRHDVRYRNNKGQIEGNFFDHRVVRRSIKKTFGDFRPLNERPLWL